MQSGGPAMQNRIPTKQSAARPRRRGAVTVEFAVVAPLIFLLFLGALELTALNFVRQTASNASYEAARKLIIPGGTTQQAEAEALRLMNALGVGKGVTVQITNTSTQASVTITVPASQNSWGLVRFCGGMNLRQTCSLTKE